jgi:hypothetical protein
MTAQTEAVRMGGSTSPSKRELMQHARIILNYCQIELSQNKIVRLVLTFKKRAPDAQAWVFLDYLAAAVQLSDEQSNRVRSEFEGYRPFKHNRDPIGEHATNLVRHADPTGEKARTRERRKVLSANG